MASTGYTGEVWCYEIWSCLWPNIGVDISSAADIKREAINCYASQVAYVDYAEGALGLNRYRGMKLGAGDAAGSLCLRSANVYRRLPNARGRVIGGVHGDRSRGPG